MIQVKKNTNYSTGFSLVDNNLIIDDAYLTNHIRSTFSDLYINEYLRLYASCVYEIKNSRTDSRKICILYDNIINETNATQTTSANQPKLSTTRQNNRYYIEFKKADNTRLISNINLNPIGGAKDSVNIFIVYKITGVSNSYWTANGLSGHDDGGFDKFVSTSNTTHAITYKDASNVTQNANIFYLLVAGEKTNYITLQPTTTSNIPYSEYQTIPGVMNRWNVLSIHWDVDNASSRGITDKSEIWCNGVKLKYFTSRPSTGSNQMTFGEICTRNMCQGRF